MLYYDGEGMAADMLPQSSGRLAPDSLAMGGTALNLLESLFSAAVKPETPMHVGEVQTLWAYAVAIDEGRNMCLLMNNHTSDPELRERMIHYVAEVEEPQRKRLYAIMKDEGLPLPPVTSDKAKADPNEVPIGAKMTDGEIANVFMAKLIAALQLLQMGMIQALRNDVASMLYGFQNELLRESFILKEMMAKRGWLKTPPLHPTSARLPVRAN